MKQIVSAILLLMAFTSLQAESYKVLISHPMKIYESGSIDEAMALSQEWRSKVLLKNPHMLDVEYLLTKESDTRYELMVIYVYENKEGAALANQAFGELINGAWPDPKERQAFFTKLQSYIVQDEKVTKAYDVIAKE